MNISVLGELFLNNLIITVCSCILPILVGAIYLPMAKKNPKEKRKAPIIALIPESLSPFIAILMMVYIRSWLSRSVFNYPLPEMLFVVLTFTICFIAYIPKRQHEDYSVRKDLIVNSLGLLSTVFMWSLTPILSMQDMGLGDYIYQIVRMGISRNVILPVTISFLLPLILQGVRYWVEYHVLRDDTPKTRNNTSDNVIIMGNKSKIVAALLAFFLGGTGAHRYYLGYIKQAITQTCGLVSIAIGYAMYIPAMLGDGAGMLFLSAIFLLFGAGTGIWAFVDFIRILTGGLTPADGSAYTENRPAQVQVVQTAPSASDNMDALEKLAKLHEQGILTDEEFQKKKADILAKM